MIAQSGIIFDSHWKDVSQQNDSAVRSFLQRYARKTNKISARRKVSKIHVMK